MKRSLSILRRSGLRGWGAAGLLAATAWGLSACSSPTREQNEVQLMTEEQAAGCQYLGNTAVSVWASVGSVARLPEAVEENLLVEARRQAVRMAGDTVVKGESAAFGMRGFRVYRCR